MMVRSRRRRDGDIGSAVGRAHHHFGSQRVVVDLFDPAVRARGRHDPVRQVDVDRLSARRHLDACASSSVWCSAAGPATRRCASWYVGALGVLGADCVYGWIQLHGSWKVGGPTDLGWVLFYVCWGAAALHPAMRELTLEQPWRPRQLKPVTLALLERVGTGRPASHRLA